MTGGERTSVTRSDGNVVRMLQRRQLGGRCNVYRKDLKILRSIILRGKTEYRKVWEKQSKSHISCEGSRVYFDNYKSCHAGIGKAGVPRQLYRLQDCPNSSKIEDALICNIAPEVIPLPHSGHKGSIVTITSNRWLQRHDLRTGAILEAVYLSPNKKFRELGWISEQERFYIRSTHTTALAVHRQAGIPVCIVMVLAVFNIFPLEFVGMLEIDKRVFGSDVTDAMLSQDLLIVMHQSGHVRLYNFNHILEQYRSYKVDLREKIPGSDAVCGQYPSGVPFNIQITESLTPLFETRCSEHNVQIGGFPWHYIIIPHGCYGWFQVHSLETDKMAKNGEVNVNSYGIELDKAVFHGDESGRVLHISEDTVRVLQLSCQDSGCETVVREVFSIHPNGNTHKKETTQRTVTSSGRSIKKRVILDEVSECSPLTIHDVDYENELDVLVVSAISHNPEGPVGHVGYYDNLTGELLREFSLEEPAKEYYEHRIFVDADTIVQRVKVTPGKFICIVYKLFGVADDDKEKTSKRQQKDVAISSRSSRRTRQSRSARYNL
ncbi:DDB1- and CUL4-associated factor 17-like [Haliotis rufescens]|uniref:DDB1- and CUL4-associated factor 17-like n=1 Tax=Haliotis rufescens TaxID=6454 RepID=UPI00201EF287|nr:DDB1- and CUL4-associated factor 17-like [Haliotis rufescens]